MDQLICIDASYEPLLLDFWGKHGVNYPKLNELITVREVVRHTTGETGIRTNEYLNPTVPVNGYLGTLEMEPSFHIRRFAHLNGDMVTKEEIKEFKELVKKREKVGDE